MDECKSCTSVQLYICEIKIFIKKKRKAIKLTKLTLSVEELMFHKFQIAGEINVISINIY